MKLVYSKRAARDPAAEDAGEGREHLSTLIQKIRGNEDR